MFSKVRCSLTLREAGLCVLAAQSLSPVQRSHARRRKGWGLPRDTRAEALGEAGLHGARGSGEPGPGLRQAWPCPYGGARLPKPP